MSDANLQLLVVGAHPDDAEVHVGGILALAAKAGLRAGILDLTAGELGTLGTPHTRRAEALESARILGVERTQLDLPDGRFDEGEANRMAVLAELRRLRPEILVLPAPDDRHPDHRRAHRLAREAAYYSGLRNYPASGAPWRPAAIAWVAGENPTSPPNLLVDVGRVWEQRMAAFDAFGSQFRPEPGAPPTRISHPAFRRGVLGRAMHYGSLVLADWAEGLWCEKPCPPALLEFLGKLAVPAR